MATNGRQCWLWCDRWLTVIAQTTGPSQGRHCRMYFDAYSHIDLQHKALFQIDFKVCAGTTSRGGGQKGSDVAREEMRARGLGVEGNSKTEQNQTDLLLLLLGETTFTGLLTPPRADRW